MHQAELCGRARPCPAQHRPRAPAKVCNLPPFLLRSGVWRAAVGAPGRGTDTMRLTRRSLVAGATGIVGSGLVPRWALAQAPRRGGTLIVAADTEPRNLNPAMVASNGVFYVASKVIEPLAEMAYGGEGLSPRLATAWEGAADGRSVTFRLAEGVTWHDGKPFTSADVAFSALEIWKKLQNLGRVVLKDLEAVETPDARTAVFRFASPTPFQLIRNALPALLSLIHILLMTTKRKPLNTR